MSKIDELVNRFGEERKKFTDAMQTEMKALFKVFFEENPTITVIQWYQYTPYFNDGDECTFSVHELHFALEGDGEAERGEEWRDERMTPEELKFKTFRNAVSQIPDDIFRDVFGDHCQVTATREGFEIEEYEHE